MKLKLFAVLLLVFGLLVSGCVDDEAPEVIDENDSEDLQANDTPVEENETSEVDEPQIEEEEDDRLEIIPPEGAQTYTVRLENFLVQPHTLEINRGDTIVWINFNDPKRIFTVVSNEGEWDNFSLDYRRQYDYTFNESGNYTYKILGFEERMKGTIIVK